MIRKSVLIALMLAAVAGLVFGADKAAPKTTPAPKEEAAPAFLGGRDLGLIINIIDPFTLAGAGDGVQAGLGMKLWLSDRGVLRGLLALDFQSDGATTDMGFGLSAAYEYHLSTGKVSPYVGGIVGTAIDLGTVQNLAFYLGGLLGAEVLVMERVALFAEYGLLFRMDEPDFFIDLGIGNNAHLGVIIYLQ
jgi:hypothetical protein